MSLTPIGNVQSDSEDKDHVISRVEENGGLHCDCLSYRFTKGPVGIKDCKHTRAYRADHSTQVDHPRALPTTALAAATANRRRRPTATHATEVVRNRVTIETDRKIETFTVTHRRVLSFEDD